MEVEYELAPDDILAFNEYRNAQSPTIRRRLFVGRLVRPILLIGLWLIFVGIGFLNAGFEIMILLGVFFAVAGVISYLTYPARYRRGARRLYEDMLREGLNHALFAVRRLTITPETITEVTEITATTMKWVAIERIVVDRRHVYFFTGAFSAIVLPIAAFASEDRFREFVETAQRYHREAGG
jgi:hypothetical protein